MKKIILITIILGFFTNGYSQFIYDKNNNIDIYGNYIPDIVIENLKGKVKEVITLSFNAIEANGNYSKAGYYFSNEIGWIYQYNIKGNLTKQNKLTDSLNLSKSIDRYENIFESDINNKINKIVKKDKRDNTSDKTYSYEYGKHGEIYRISILKSNNDLYYSNTLKYNKKTKQIISKKTENKNSKSTYKFEYKKLDNGNIEFIKYDNRKINEIITFDKTGNVIEKKESRSQIISRSPMKTKSYYEIETYQYDTYDNVIKQEKTKSEVIIEFNKDNPIRTYKYEYDDNNNWIKKIAFKDGKVIYLEERTIEYFE